MAKSSAPASGTRRRARVTSLGTPSRRASLGRRRGRASDRGARPRPRAAAGRRSRTAAGSGEELAARRVSTETVLGVSGPGVGAARWCARSSMPSMPAKNGAAEERRPALAGCRVDRRRFAADVEQHDDEQEEHHDGAGVDEDLERGQERRAEQHEEHGDREQRHHQAHRRVHRVPVGTTTSAEPTASARRGGRSATSIRRAQNTRRASAPRRRSG